MIENLIVKQGYVLVKAQSAFEYNLSSGMCCATIVAGADTHKDAVVFYESESYVLFDDQYLLVKVDDILAWIKPEEQPSNEPKNDPA